MKRARWHHKIKLDNLYTICLGSPDNPSATQDICLSLCLHHQVPINTLGPNVLTFILVHKTLACGVFHWLLIACGVTWLQELPPPYLSIATLPKENEPLPR